MEAFLLNILAQLWKETCDSRLENKKLGRERTNSPDTKYSITDVVKNENKEKFMTVKQGFKVKDVIEVVELVSFDDKKVNDSKRQKWKKSETDENGFFNLTNPHYGKLLTAKERNKWTLEGKLV